MFHLKVKVDNRYIFFMFKMVEIFYIFIKVKKRKNMAVFMLKMYENLIKF